MAPRAFVPQRGRPRVATSWILPAFGFTFSGAVHAVRRPDPDPDPALLTHEIGMPAERPPTRAVGGHDRDAVVRCGGEQVAELGLRSVAQAIREERVLGHGEISEITCYHRPVHPGRID